MKNRRGKLLVMAMVLGGGLLLWRTGLFGVFPTDRTLIWRLPVSYGEVRKVELQVWGGEELLKRSELEYPTGIVGEPSLKVPLAAGPHRAIANVWLKNAEASIGFSAPFDPAAEETIVIDMKKP